MTDSERLHWLLSRGNVDKDREVTQGKLGEFYMTTYLCGHEPGANGVSGTYIARGKSWSECIDKFIAGNVAYV